MSTTKPDAHRPIVMGILNLSEDSFSDGGKYVDSAAALTHAETLLRGGADVIDVGAQASNPSAAEVSPDEEIERLFPVVSALKRRGVRVSVDTFRPAVMRAMLALDVDYINDIRGFASAESRDVVRDARAKLVVMHAVHSDRAIADGFEAARAEPMATDVTTIVTRVERWLRERAAQLEAYGIARDRLILDPGMGFFLGSDPRLSIEVLRNLPALFNPGLPVMISVSRKSFVGALLADRLGEVPPPMQRGIGTLAAEAFAVSQGATYIRTHEPQQLRDFLRVANALEPL